LIGVNYYHLFKKFGTFGGKTGILNRTRCTTGNPLRKH
jgi:hypothetical protein